jgi:predicted nucleic acid-binding protein
MNVVLDTSVLVSAILWPGESRECLVAWRLTTHP